MLKTTKIAAVRTVVTAAPAASLRQLASALGAETSGPAMLVRDLIEAELTERAARDLAFAPIGAMCLRPRHAAGLQSFPSDTPAQLWAIVKGVASEETQALLIDGGQDPGETAACADRLCLRAAEGLRGGEWAFAALAEALCPAAAARLALALELAPLVRASAEEVPTWVARATGAHVAAMRLLYKDAARLGDDAGPLLIELLLAQMDEPWRVLQLIGWVMDKPDERFVAESELAGVALRLIDSIDGALATVRGFQPERGSAAAEAAAQALETGLATVVALETAFALKRGPWADRVKRQRAALAAEAETRLREAEALVSKLLPPPPMKLAGRTLGGGSRFAEPPESATLAKGRGLLTFLSETHAVAEPGGFAALWARVAKLVDDRLAAATDELIGMLHAGMGGARPLQRHLDVAADLTTVMRGAQAGALVRRRAAAA